MCQQALTRDAKITVAMWNKNWNLTAQLSQFTSILGEEDEEGEEDVYEGKYNKVGTFSS